MNRKSRSREIGRPPSPEAQNRVKFTTKLNKNLLRGLRRLAGKKGKMVNELIEEAVEGHFPSLKS